MSKQEPTLEEIFQEMLVEFEVFCNNSEQLIKEAKTILRKQKKDKR